MEQTKAKDFDATLQRILNNEIEPPNMAEVTDPKEALALLVNLRGKIHEPQRVRMGTGKFDNYYPRVFTNQDGMYGKFSGDGAILTAHARVVKFQLCIHDWDTSGANHQRGWHPRRCKLCGFDASIDSGD